MEKEKKRDSQPPSATSAVPPAILGLKIKRVIARDWPREAFSYMTTNALWYAVRIYYHKKKLSSVPFNSRTMSPMNLGCGEFATSMAVPLATDFVLYIHVSGYYPLMG